MPNIAPAYQASKGSPLDVDRAFYQRIVQEQGARKLVEKLVVYPERMRRNLELTRGLVFSGQLLLDLAAAGMLREEAYERVQKHAMQAWENEGDFRAAIEADEKILSYLSIAEINTAFSLDRHLAHVDQIFARVFGENHI